MKFLLTLSAADIRSMQIRGAYLHERIDNAEESGLYHVYQTSIDAFQKQIADGPVYIKDYYKSLDKQARGMPMSAGMPEWYAHLLSVMDNNDSTENFLKPDWPFARSLSPIVASLVRTISPQIRAKENLIEKSIVSCAARAFYNRVLNIAGVTLYVDYKEYCTEKNTLPTASEFAAWEKAMLAGRWEKIAFKYPVMVRFLYEAEKNFLAMIGELLDRYARDVNDFTVFSPEPYFLEDIYFDLSDLHNRGRTVCKLFFVGGRTLYYKPKPLENEKWFHEKFLPNIEGIDSAVGRIKILSKNGYGWVEDISTIVSAGALAYSKKDVSKIVSLFYALNGTDMHEDNLLRRGNKVYPVDLETILNSVRRNSGEEHKGKEWKKLDVVVTEILPKGLSTETYMGRGESELSEIGFTSYKKIFFHSCSQEGVRIELRTPSRSLDAKTAQEKVGSLPDSNGDVSIKDFVDTFVAIKTLAETKGFFEDETLNSCVVRSVLRDTNFYARILSRLQQPKLLTDGALVSLDLSDVFLSLKDADEETGDLKGPILYNEILQFLDGDIPYFWQRANSCDLMSHHGLIAKNYFQRSGIAEFKAKLTEASLSDIILQARLTEASMNLQNKRMYSEGAVHETAEVPTDILSICKNIAEKIISTSIKEDCAPAKWVSYDVGTDGRHFYPTVTGQGYYSGYWGILMYLVSVQKVLAEKHQANDSIERFLDEERCYWADHKDALKFKGKPCLGISGLGGVLISLTAIFQCDPRWNFIPSMIGEFLLEMAESAINDDTLIDVIGGNAGFIFALSNIVDSSLYEHLSKTEKERLKTFARQTAKTLVGQIKESGWLPESEEENSLIGFAHGNAGCIAALQMVVNRAVFFNIDDALAEKINGAIAAALEYQGNHKIDDQSNWKDLRGNRENKTYPLNYTWCHGVPGAGLAMLTQLHRGDLSNDMERMLALSTQEKFFSYDYYCCGEVGEIDFLLEASRCLEARQDLYERALDRMQSLLGIVHRRDSFKSRIGHMNINAFPSLFQGIAGIGYVALRFIDESLPNICGFKAR